MKKSYLSLLLLFSIVCLPVQADSSRLHGISISDDVVYASRLGDSSCEMTRNGEHNVIKNLIRDGDLVVDVGASQGDWSKHVFALHDGVIVYAFEPLPDVFETLQHLFKNKLGVAYNLALSNKSGSADFYYYSKTYRNSRLSGFYDRDILREKMNLVPEKITVDVETLDAFCAKNNIDSIDFLKIDTEGEELNVLKGAEALLQQKAIAAIQFEYGGCFVDARTTLKQVYDLLTAHGYEIFRIYPKGLIRIAAWNDRLENYKYCNYLAVLP